MKFYLGKICAPVVVLAFEGDVVIVPVKKARPSDYSKILEGKNLLKLFQRYTRTVPLWDDLGNKGSLGHHTKLKKSGQNGQTYIATRLSFIEYFAFEILNQIGFVAPKARFTRGERNKLCIISSAIDGYFPISAFFGRASSNLKSSDITHNIIKQFRIKIEEQRVFDRKTNKLFPIRGNIFASYLTECLLQDYDLQIEGENTGLIRQGGGFKAALIDKGEPELCLVNTYEELTQKSHELSGSFIATTKEQKLSMAANIAELILEIGGPSPLEKIFFNSITGNMFKEFIPQVFEVSIFYKISSMVKPGNHEYNNMLIEIKKILSIKIAEYTKKHADTKLETYDDVMKFCNGIKNEMTLTFDSFEKTQYFDPKHRQHITEKFNECESTWNPCLIIDLYARNAAIIVNHHFKSSQELQNYYDRERLRIEIAKKVVNEVMQDHPDAAIAIDNMVEDLRGVYYQHAIIALQTHALSAADIDNENLLYLLKRSLVDEYLLSSQKTPTVRPD